MLRQKDYLTRLILLLCLLRCISSASLCGAVPDVPSPSSSTGVTAPSFMDEFKALVNKNPKGAVKFAVIFLGGKIIKVAILYCIYQYWFEKDDVSAYAPTDPLVGKKWWILFAIVFLLGVMGLAYRKQFFRGRE